MFLLAAVVLLLAGPVRWIVLAVLAFLLPRDRSETLSVQIPWSTAAQERADALRRQQRSG